MHMEKLLGANMNRLWRVWAATIIAVVLASYWQSQVLDAAEQYAPAVQTAPASGGDDDGGHTDDGYDGSGDEFKVYGLLTLSPTVGLTGTWIIDSTAFTATENTEFSTSHGDFAIGGCVEVEVAEGDPTVAKEIGTEESWKCSTGGDHGDDHEDDHQADHEDGDDHGDDGHKVYGIIDKLPESGLLTGTWIVSGLAYTVTDSTDFDNEFGGFAQGVCVEIELDGSDPTVAHEIETEEDYKCSGQDNGGVAHGELYGVVDKLPDNGLIGTWIVGGKGISVTAQTEVKSASAMTVGVTVKVEFQVLDDTLVAREIELKFGPRGDDHHADDHHDDDFGDHHGKEGHAFGIVNSISDTDGVSGTIWMIGVVSYTVTDRTKVDDGAGLNDLVEVKYFVRDDGSRFAFKIEPEDGRGRMDNPSIYKLVGTVEQTPTVGFVGPWIIAGAEFSGTLQTRFQEEHGLLGVGAYVQVLYWLKDSVRVMLKVESHVPPGAGDFNKVGEVESLQGDDAAVVVSALTSLTVGGVSYSVNPATQIVDSDGEITVGATVDVNSYSTDEGEQVATRIRSVSLDSKLVVPFVLR